jgi:hypothetical protein
MDRNKILVQDGDAHVFVDFVHADLGALRQLIVSIEKWNSQILRIIIKLVVSL